MLDINGVKNWIRTTEVDRWLEISELNCPREALDSSWYFQNSVEGYRMSRETASKKKDRKVNVCMDKVECRPLEGTFAL